jgi:iron(III) transport system ATP-binding protein
MLNLVGLEGMGKRYPHELSGGQQQRVALARALAPNPQLLLLDEPFSNLDVNLRQQLRDEIHTILSQAGITTVLVTHDQEEALSLADCLAVIDRGQIVQYATPDEVVQQPSTRFVATFLGLGHFLAGEMRPNGIATELGHFPHHDDLKQVNEDRRVDVLVRPESVHLCSHHDGTPAQVVRSSFRGTRKLYTLRLPSGAQVSGLFSQDMVLRAGDQIRVSWHPDHLVTFSSNDAPETRVPVPHRT